MRLGTLKEQSPTIMQSFTSRLKHEKESNIFIRCSECPKIPILEVFYKDNEIYIRCKCENEHITDIKIEHFITNHHNFNIEKLICCKCKTIKDSSNIQFYYCFDCNTILCKNCKKKFESLNCHSIIQTYQFDITCHKHKQKFCSFCKECNKALCMFCSNEHIKEHNIDFLPKIFEKCSIKMNDKKIRNNYINLKNYIYTCLNEIEEKISKIKQIFQKFEETKEIQKNIVNILINNFIYKRRIQEFNYEVARNLNYFNENFCYEKYPFNLNHDEKDNCFIRLEKIYNFLNNFNKKDYEIRDELNKFFYNDFNLKVLEIINKMRKNPKEYSNIIKNSIENIITDKHNRLIYNGKLKVALCTGVPAFLEAAEILNESNSINPLKLKNEICIPVPENEKEMKSPNFLKEKIISINNENIISYWKSLVNDPELCILLSIVDDVWFKPGQKRKDLLNPNIKYIGISSKQFGKNFCVYFVLSK